MATIGEILDKKLKSLEDLDLLYPARHRTIHKDCCERCPSDQNRREVTEDPESKHLKERIPKEELVKEYLFVCAWRPSKLCKGLCDYMEIDQDFINQIKD